MLHAAQNRVAKLPAFLPRLARGQGGLPPCPVWLFHEGRDFDHIGIEVEVGVLLRKRIVTVKVFRPFKDERDFMPTVCRNPAVFVAGDGLSELGRLF